MAALLFKDSIPMEQEAYRHIPYDIEIEQALLGAILVDNQALERVGALIKPDHFYDPLHARIFETMSAAVEPQRRVATAGVLKRGETAPSQAGSSPSREMASKMRGMG